MGIANRGNLNQGVGDAGYLEPEDSFPPLTYLDDLPAPISNGDGGLPSLRMSLVFLAAAIAPNLLTGPLGVPPVQTRAPMQAAQFVTRRPPSAIPPNLLTTLLASTAGAPFKNYDSRLSQRWAVDRSAAGFAATVYLPANTPPLSLYDWPLPRAAPRIEQTWTQNWLTSTFVAATYEARAPSQAPRLIAARPTFFDPPNLLISTLAPIGPAPFIPKDWPLPKTAPALVRGDAQGIPLAIFAQIQGKPFASVDTGVGRPTGPQQSWSCNLLLTTLGVAQPMPFAQRDWQLPRAQARIDQTYAQSLLSSTLSSAPTPFVAPASVIFSAKWVDRSWTQNLALTLSQPIGAKSPDGPARQTPALINWSQNLLASTLSPGLPIGAASPPIQRAAPRAIVGEGQSPPLALLAGAVTFFYPPRVIVYPDADRIVYVGSPRTST